MENEKRRKFVQQAVGGILFATLPACRNESPRTLKQGGQFPEIQLLTLDGVQRHRQLTQARL